VDDDIDDVEMFIEALKCVDATIQCRHANSTREALHLLLNDFPKPDGIFVDFHLPGSSGYECVQAIRSHDELKTIPLVLISGFVTTQQVDQFNKIGVYYFLSKSALSNRLEPALKVIIDSLCKNNGNSSEHTKH
jgi:DNA-binding NtrC family response regulator